MKEETIKQFLEFEKSMMSCPRTLFPMFVEGVSGRSKIIYNEYVEWKKSGGKHIDLEFKDLTPDVIVWKIGNESFAQQIDKFAPFSKEQYKKGLSSIYSFMQDRPQYYKFRELKGMFNPLRLLLYEFIF